ncbi:TetR/AcrR family transcriptional regulator [Kribbella deserti]|uniref:TetR/AcrR family transcriptional regulator n=1 Tax=Kribbella deserti TaxID=1926257 RepID=A0ABV6QIM7_9ACTN
MPKGPTKRRPQTHARLLDAALQMFAAKGFHAATIEDICEQAGFTRGAFYSNFATKDELFFALFDLRTGHILERVAAVVDELADVADPLEALVERLVLEEQDERWHLVSAEFTLHAARNAKAAEILTAHDERLRGELAELLRRLFASAGRTPTVDVDLLARLLVAIREGGMAQSLVEPDRLPAGRLEQAFLPTILRAVSRAT